MERRETYRTNRIFRASAVLLCLVILTTWYVGGLFAKYTTSGSMEDHAGTAVFVFDIKDVEGNFVIPVTDITKPGDQSVYKFVVTNEKNSVISEVAEEYTITMKLNGSMPVKCELKKNNSSTESVELSKTEIVTQVTKDAATDTFSAAVEEKDEYTLTVDWPVEYNDAKFANGSALAEVQLHIKAVQID